MARVLEAIQQMFYPDGIKCIVCDGELDHDDRYCLCDRCRLHYNTKFCLYCGKAIANMADYCDRCMNARYDFDDARAPFVYEGAVIGLVHRLKYGNGQYLAPPLAQFMADTYYENGWTADYLTFVPMPQKRQHRRGYNQAQLLAESLSPIVGLPVIETLAKVKETKNLARLDRKQRAAAILDSFALLSEAAVKRRRVLLIDDVMTSSATANECARMLKKGGADEVRVLTFATARVRPLLY